VFIGIIFSLEARRCSSSNKVLLDVVFGEGRHEEDGLEARNVETESCFEALIRSTLLEPEFRR